MVLVTLEAQVPKDQWKALERAYAHAMTHRPDTIVMSLLARDSHDPTLWRILTVWESREALIAHYESGATMPSMYTFHLVGIAPVGSPSDVVAYA
jgi:quinol monooxygenase YgiN